MKFCLTIAGSDPTGGAGLQADLRVFSAMGIHGLAVPSALTVQNTEGIVQIVPVERMLLERQLDFLLKDIRPDSLKTGMLYSTYAPDIVAYMVKKYSLTNLVIDPVTVSSTGTSLVEDGTLDMIKTKLFPVSKVITPNIYEASVFTGINIETEMDMQHAASALRKMGPQTVIVTGGHLEKKTMDLYYDGFEFYWMESEKIEGDYHGTGCAFSASITALLALGYVPREAAQKTKEFMQEAIKAAYHPGKGMRILDVRRELCKK